MLFPLLLGLRALGHFNHGLVGLHFHFFFLHLGCIFHLLFTLFGLGLSLARWDSHCDHDGRAFALHLAVFHVRYLRLEPCKP